MSDNAPSVVMPIWWRILGAAMMLLCLVLLLSGFGVFGLPESLRYWGTNAVFLYLLAIFAVNWKPELIGAQPNSAEKTNG